MWDNNLCYDTMHTYFYQVQDEMIKVWSFTDIWDLHYEKVGQIIFLTIQDMIGNFSSSMILHLSPKVHFIK